MSTRESFRYCWIKVTDADARASTMRSALQLQQKLVARAQAAPPGSDESRFVRNQLVMARAYLGGDIERGIRVIIVPAPEGASLSLDLLATGPHAVSRDGVEISMATMPSGYTRDDAHAWLETPVGETWAQGALACRLVHSVVTAEESPATTAESDANGVHA